MLGERREYLDLDQRGIRADRLFAVRDANGKIGSGKNTRRFAQIDGLLRFRAVCDGDVPTVLFPDGRAIRGENPEIHAALSDALGQPVTLIRETAISHLDAEPISILTRASLLWLQGALPDSSADARRFRPNLLLDLAGERQNEQSWIGKVLIVGDSVKLRVSASIERCRMVTLEQEDLVEDPRILRCIAQESQFHFGLYAEVLVPGKIKRGDRVTSE